MLALPRLLWGNAAKLSYLLFAAFILLFIFLGQHDIWTQEHRWADIVSGMFFRHDFLHPYLYGNHDYYDKPLLSYWMMALVSKVTGTLSLFELRFPSALAGLCSVYAIYRLGTLLKNEALGLLAAWLLLTNFFFLFWARTSSADMLNMAGALMATTWYMSKRDVPSFVNYTVFFFILAFSALCKGLGAVVVSGIAVLTDMLLRRSLKQHLNWTVCCSMLFPLIIYLLPFYLSNYYGKHYASDGLSLVYRENILRYFHPFDHQEPIYIYFFYLPLYLVPSVFFFVPALIDLLGSWKKQRLYSKWLIWTIFLLFLFFTGSGSRRAYYILPVIPFVVLWIADWLLHQKKKAMLYQAMAAWMIVLTYVVLFIYVSGQAWYYTHFGTRSFVNRLQHAACLQHPWPMWRIVLLDASEKVKFYLHLPPVGLYYEVSNCVPEQAIAKIWPTVYPVLKPPSILVTRQQYMPFLTEFFATKKQKYTFLSEKYFEPFFFGNSNNNLVAFILP